MGYLIGLPGFCFNTKAKNKPKRYGAYYLNTFVNMLYHLPRKGLIRLNIALIFLLSVLLVVFLLALDHDIEDIIYRFFQSIVFTTLISFGNFWLLHLNERYKAKHNKIILYLCSYIGAFVVWLFVIKVYSIATGNAWEGERGTAMAYVLAVLAIFFFNTVILVVQNLFIFQYRNMQNEMEKLQLKASLSDTTILLLRQQIKPHFLFNALATVKSLYKQDVKVGEEYLVRLADFLRVSVSNPTAHTVLIKDEIAFCINYLKMQKIRFGSAIEYQIKISEPTLNKKYLPYFSLQPLLENVLKHNALTEEKPINIVIDEQDDFIVVRNNIQHISTKEESAGNGLYNLKERYRLLGEEEIKITSDELFFTVYLKILKK